MRLAKLKGQKMEIVNKTEMEIANEITSQMTGKMINLESLYNPKTGKWISEDELIAKGAVFCTVKYNKVLTIGGDLVVKSRITGNPTPFIRKEWIYQMILNIDWQSYINRRSSHKNFQASKKRVNGVENYEGCRAIGITRQGKPTICGVIFRKLQRTKYFDEEGQEYTDIESLKAEYIKVPSKKSKKKEAEKHGIEVSKDPQYRTPRIDSCGFIRCFGYEYTPIQKSTVKVSVKDIKGQKVK